MVESFTYKYISQFCVILKLFSISHLTSDDITPLNYQQSHEPFTFSHSFQYKVLDSSYNSYFFYILIQIIQELVSFFIAMPVPVCQCKKIYCDLCKLQCLEKTLACSIVTFQKNGRCMRKKSKIMNVCYAANCSVCPIQQLRDRIPELQKHLYSEGEWLCSKK